MKTGVVLLLAGRLAAGLFAVVAPHEAGGASVQGLLLDSTQTPIAGADVRLQCGARGDWNTVTDAKGRFALTDGAQGSCSVSVVWQGRLVSAATPLTVGSGMAVGLTLRILSGSELRIESGQAGGGADGSGGEQLSSRDVASLPLNKRDFSHLLLLAAGTMTDSSGTLNFTQQFAVNGQRGSTAVFSMDGVDSSDPELGGATFSNFNVDAIQELDSSSGVMPAQIGRGAAAHTNIVTKSGTSQIHGSAFWFVRNAAFDARNFFDRRSTAQSGRIPPFVRNEFGVTNGGPVMLPGIYNGRNRTYYFAQYQGFRQVLGTTQVFPVPTPEERQGKNTTAFPGDTLLVPVDPRIAPVLARYPLPNDPTGAFGARTYAISSKVSTVSDQFSARIDHEISPKARLFGRFTLNNVDGPLTNPSQTAIDPSFATRFLDRQRNFGVTYTRTVNPHFTSETGLGFQRSTPSFPPLNDTQPALRFVDGVYEPFNSAAGGLTVFYGNLFQARQNFTWTRGTHAFKAGGEVRANRDTFFGSGSANGAYTFAAGGTYSPVSIRSASGLHDIQPGDPLPDALTGLLTATPYSYSISAAPPGLPSGDRMGEVAIRRESYNVYFQDTWKATPRLVVDWGLRYEANSPMRAADNRTSGIEFVDASGKWVGWDTPGAAAKLLVNLHPTYEMDWNGWGPRLNLDWKLDSRSHFYAGGTIVTILPNLSQDNLIMAAAPFVVTPLSIAAPGAAVRFENTVPQVSLPPIYTPGGELIFGPGKPAGAVAANTEVDVERFNRDLAAATPDHRIRPIGTAGMWPNFRNGYIGTWSAGLEHKLDHSVSMHAAYTATAGIKLARVDYPNGGSGASPEFAPFTQFDANGKITGGFGPMLVVTNRSHSSFHSLQMSASKSALEKGPAFQVSYTFSKSIDDISAIVYAPVQDPRNPGLDRGPSAFDVTHGFSSSVAQILPVERVPFLRPLGRRLTSGWQLFGVVSLASGPPFTILSGIQQTGAGAANADRPDQVVQPVLSTSRTVREDYFGRGADNASFFSVPIQLPGGTGPNKGRFGTLGRNTFRGPGYRNLDVALIKETRIAGGPGGEVVRLQFRAEAFNVFNLVTFGSPANKVLGPGFGIINQTAGTSRQIQLSLKLLY